jgi:hypothetical protein
MGQPAVTGSRDSESPIDKKSLERIKHPARPPLQITFTAIQLEECVSAIRSAIIE